MANACIENDQVAQCLRYVFKTRTSGDNFSLSSGCSVVNLEEGNVEGGSTEATDGLSHISFEAEKKFERLRRIRLEFFARQWQVEKIAIAGDFRSGFSIDFLK